MAQDTKAAERALKRELQSYKARTGRLLVVALLLFVVGVALLFFFTPSPDAQKTGWLYERFGERGPILGAKAFGVLVILQGAWFMWRVVQRMTVGVRTLEASSRKTLGLPAAGPLEAGRA